MADDDGEAGAKEDPAAGGAKSLEEQLAEFEHQKEDAQKAQVDANIADLVKLIEDAKKADEDYAGVYDQLKDDEARLKGERDTILAALTAVLGDDGIKAVKDIVTAKVQEVRGAEMALGAADRALGNAQTAADAAATKLAAAKAKLDVWRKPGDAIGARLKSAQTLVDEIKKLRNGGRRGEAYWKLALGDHAKVPGQNFLNAVLSREPQIIPPADLKGRIETLWGELTDARSDAAAKALALDKAKTAQKDADAKFKDLTKNLIKAITDALAEREAQADAA